MGRSEEYLVSMFDSVWVEGIPDEVTPMMLIGNRSSETDDLISNYPSSTAALAAAISEGWEEQFHHIENLRQERLEEAEAIALSHAIVLDGPGDKDWVDRTQFELEAVLSGEDLLSSATMSMSLSSQEMEIPLMAQNDSSDLTAIGKFVYDSLSEIVRDIDMQQKTDTEIVKRLNDIENTTKQAIVRCYGSSGPAYLQDDLRQIVREVMANKHDNESIRT